MDRKTVLWLVIGVLFLAVLVAVFNVGAGVSTNIVSGATNTGGAASSAMVGGC